MYEFMAFSADQVSRLTGLSPWQLRHWATTDFFPPEHRDEDRTPFGRVYSFRDVVGLRALAKLRKEHKVSLQELRRAGKWLGERFRDPWATLTLYVVNRKVIFSDPDTGLRLHPGSPSQIVLPIEITKISAETVAAVKQMQRRSPSQVGKVARNRYLQHNAPVVAGTRIPTATLWEFYEDGYDIEGIQREYPSLTKKDIEAALRYERQRRKKRRAG